MKKLICVTGLGCIGLPMACILAESGYPVLGVDSDEAVIKRLQSLTLVSSEPRLKRLLARVIQNRNLTFSAHAVRADVYIIAVPTPLGVDRQPDISYVEAAVDAILPHLQPENLVLIESTCPIGTTDLVADKVKNVCSGVHVAYSPERVLPGNILHELVHNDRVVGGVNEAATFHAVAFYQSFIQGEVLATDVRMAEAVKLAENAYRDINIAYANELSMIAEPLGLDVNEWIRLANRHPRVDILQPGPGVGGHCIAIDPWFLAWSAPDVARLILKGREVNTKKTSWVIDQVCAVIREQKAHVVACLGLTYKPNVADIRESPAIAVVRALEKEVEVLCVDPYVPWAITFEEALSRAQIVVALVAHDHFHHISSDDLEGKVVLDFAGVFR